MSRRTITPGSKRSDRRNQLLSGGHRSVIDFQDHIVGLETRLFCGTVQDLLKNHSLILRSGNHAEIARRGCRGEVKAFEPKRLTKPVGTPGRTDSSSRPGLSFAVASKSTAFGNSASTCSKTRSLSESRPRTVAGCSSPASSMTTGDSPTCELFTDDPSMAIDNGP